jgi:hypothetical protein
MLNCLYFMNKACVKVMSMNLNVKYLCMSIEHETNKTGVKFPWHTNKAGFNSLGTRTRPGFNSLGKRKTTNRTRNTNKHDE